MAECRVHGCRRKVSRRGLACSTHAAGAKAGISGTAAAAVTSQARTETINGKGYYGGHAGQPHVHVYKNGAHLKLGGKRYNLVQGGVRYDSQIEQARDALDQHGLGDQLRPWVDAALRYFGG